MAFSDIRHRNRPVYCQKAISAPEIGSMSVLSKDAWQYVDLWLRRRGKVAERALVYWEQAHHFFRASASLPSVSSPLTSYYCFLNATKTLLLVKDCTHA